MQTETQGQDGVWDLKLQPLPLGELQGGEEVSVLMGFTWHVPQPSLSPFLGSKPGPCGFLSSSDST